MFKKKKNDDLVETCFELKFKIVTPEGEANEALKTFDEILLKVYEVLKKRTNIEIEDET